MSRSQQNQTFETAQQQNAENQATAKNAENEAQQDIGNYESQLSKFASSNPYVQGGEYQTAENQQLADTANSTANAAKAQAQSQAQRTGQNPQAAIAAGETEQQNAQRALADQQARATEGRIGDEAKYNQGVLQASAEPFSMENSLASLAANQANSELGTQEKAAETPGLLDQLTNDLIAGGAQVGAAALKG